MRRPSKKLTIAVAAAGIIAVGGATALAYWTTTGSGSGGAATAGSDTAMTIAQAGAITGLVPGGPAGTLNATVTNSTVTSAQIGDITATPTYPAGCGAANWTITHTTNGPTTVAGNSTSPSVSVATVALIDLPTVDQNACKNATVTFTFAG
jgi:hypothetical protein